MFAPTRRWVWAIIATLSVASFMLAACVSATAEDETEHEEREYGMEIPAVEPVALGEGERLRVVATTNILGDVVSRVGGGAIDLTVLIGLGRDPHSYEAITRDVMAIEDAHVVFVVGLGLEEGLMDTIEGVATGPVVPVSAGIELIELVDGHPQNEGERGHTHERGIQDPHFWLDPNNVIVWTRNVADVLSAADPANADAYAANADTYIEELGALDAAIREQVALIPEENRKLVTDHLVFGYFADEYGFEMVGTVLPGATTTTEPSAGDMAKLVDQMRVEGVKTVFIGMSASDRLQQLTELIAEEAGGDVKVLTLYTGSLGEPGTPSDSYLGMMYYNVETMVEGLRD